MFLLRVWNRLRTSRKMVKLDIEDSVNEMLEKCAKKLDINYCVGMRLVIEADGTELDEADVIQAIAGNNIVCILLAPDETWISAEGAEKLLRCQQSIVPLVKPQVFDQEQSPLQQTVTDADCVIVKTEFNMRESINTTDNVMMMTTNQHKDVSMMEFMPMLPAHDVTSHFDIPQPSSSFATSSSMLNETFPPYELVLPSHSEEDSAKRKRGRLPSLERKKNKRKISTRRPDLRMPRPVRPGIVLPSSLSRKPSRCGSCEGCVELVRQQNTFGGIRGCIEAGDGLLCWACAKLPKRALHASECVFLQCELQHAYRLNYNRNLRRSQQFQTVPSQVFYNCTG